MNERTERRRFFEASYDGATYTHTYRLDPRPLIGGIMLALISPPLLWLTWPVATTWAIPALGAAMIGLAFCSRRRFTASAQEFALSRSIGPWSWTTRWNAREVEPVYSRGRRDTYRVLLRRSRRTFDPWIEAGGRAEAEAWVNFLRDVSRGAASRLPESQAAWPFRERA
jgi:hypothetical protein